VGYWQFNNSANLGLDSSGLGNNLTTASGTPTYSSAGMFGGSLYLDGNSTMTTLSGAFPLGVPTNASPYTIAVWEKIDTGCPNNGGFVGWGVNNTSEANDFRLNGPNSVDDYWYANDFVVSGLATNPMDGNWHAIAVTWDGTNQTCMWTGSMSGRGPRRRLTFKFGFHRGQNDGRCEFQGLAGGFADRQYRADTGGHRRLSSWVWSASCPPIRCFQPPRLPTRSMRERR
jgi:hypothetical protein